VSAMHGGGVSFERCVRGSAGRFRNPPHPSLRPGSGTPARDKPPLEFRNRLAELVRLD
jgi:hypothetical protein